MRGIDTQVRKNRRRIFKEVANLAYHSENLIDDVEALPYQIVDYDESEYESIYRERAIVRERIRHRDWRRAIFPRNIMSRPLCRSFPRRAMPARRTVIW